LIWSVSLDGKKMESETHKILGILNKPKYANNYHTLIYSHI